MSVEFWIIRYGMARSRPKYTKSFETEQFAATNYTLK
jgi:hypothetical protein